MWVCTCVGVYVCGCVRVCTCVYVYVKQYVHTVGVQANATITAKLRRARVQPPTHTQPLAHTATDSRAHREHRHTRRHKHIVTDTCMHGFPTTKAEVNSCAQRRFCTLHVLCTKSLPGWCAPSAGRPLIQQHCGRSEVVPSAATSGMLTLRNAQSDRLDYSIPSRCQSLAGGTCV